MLKGGIYMVGEYRVTKADTVNYRDKVTGKAAKFSSVIHVVETGDTVVHVQARLGDDEDPTKVKAPFPKGQKVLLQVETIERVQGFLRATGTFSPVES